MISTKVTAVLRRRWPILAIAFAIGVLAGAVSSQLAPSDIVQQYRAEQVVVANSTGTGGVSVQQDSLKVTRGEIPTIAAEAMGGGERGDRLAADMSVTVDTESQAITIASVDVNPDVAAQRVNAVTTAFLDVTNGQRQEAERVRVEQLGAAAKAAEEDLATFDETYPDLVDPDAEVTDPETGEVVQDDGPDPALVSQRQSLSDAAAQARSEATVQKAQLASTQPYQSLGEQQPKRDKRGAFEVPNSLPLRATFLGLFGLLLGVILALVLERLNRRIDTRPELAEACPLPIIAEVGFVAANRRPTADGSLILTGVWAEAYRRVRSAMQFVYERGTFGATGKAAGPAPTKSDGHGGVFMFTSTAPGEGKTTSALLTAQAMAEVGVRTLLVGADFRRPALADVMGIDAGPTIADLTGPAERRPKVDQVVRPTKFPNLYLALSGRPTRDVSELIAATRQLVSQAASQNATVIIDTSPLNASSDALDLLPVVDHVIMVVRSGRSTEDDLVESIDALERVGADVMGTLLVGTPNAGRRQAYYYDYYSHEGLKDAVGPAKSFVIDDSDDSDFVGDHNDDSEDDESVDGDGSDGPHVKETPDSSNQRADEVGTTP
jgi:Mrp family chromosome partitioning ATPase